MTSSQKGKRKYNIYNSSLSDADAVSDVIFGKRKEATLELGNISTCAKTLAFLLSK